MAIYAFKLFIVVYDAQLAINDDIYPQARRKQIKRDGANFFISK